MMFYVDLDWAVFEHTVEGIKNHASDEAAKYNLAAELLTLDGPGGGNPVFRFSGTRENVLKFARDYFSGDMEMAAQVLDER